jgi:ribosome maturation factor RimP
MSTQVDKIDKIKDLITPVLEQSGDLYLVDVEIAPGRSPQVWVYLESKKGGISLDACAAISRELAVLLDAHGVFEDSYRLNVSSPGLDRPLKHPQQFISNVGRNAKVTMAVGEGKKVAVKGILKSVDDQGIVLETAQGAQRILFSELHETKILPAF